MKLNIVRRAEAPSVTEHSRLPQALAFAERGWYVFPCHWVSKGACSCGNPECGRHSGKHPLTDNGFNDATLDPTIVSQWWARWPRANIGIATGKSNLVVLDSDPEKGGDESLAEWKAQLEAVSTYVVSTGRRGRHRYFLRGHADVRTTIDLRPGIDVIADTGYVIAAGSSGLLQPYVCERDVPLAAVPLWLVEAVQQKATARGEGRVSDVWVAEAWPGVAKGNRNTMCTKLAGYLQHKQIPRNIREVMLLD